MESALRFAPLIRVSTETQQKRGESLHTQHKQLEATVNILGGEIYRWYSGQEHATPEQERKILDELLKDAGDGKFNAVIVCSTSRWSRDNRRSKEDLEILKNHHIRFFVGMTEYNLYDPTSWFILSMGVEIAEFNARDQSYNSIINRISKAEKGYPACGMIPYGRIFDTKTNQWLVDEDKKKKLEEIASTYLAEDIGFCELGARFKMNGSNVWKLLIERSGPLWKQHFRCKASNIDRVVTTNVPRLLSDDIIRRIKEKSKARRTYAHGTYKYEYLLSRIVYDSTTGRTLTGTPDSKG
jgi:site-specific DNA recombinase